MDARSLPTLALLLTISAQAAPADHVRLRADTCYDVPPTLLATLGEDWQILRAYVQLCPVRAPDGALALSALTIRVDRAMRDNFFGTHRSAVVPHTVILDRQNRAVGSLVDGFPENPPSKLEVAFTDWHDAFPWRIDLYDAGISALDPHPIPSLFWDERQHHYVEGPDLTWDAQRHRYLEAPLRVWDERRQQYGAKPVLVWDKQHRWFVEVPTRAALSGARGGRSDMGAWTP